MGSNPTKTIHGRSTPAYVMVQLVGVRRVAIALQECPGVRGKSLSMEHYLKVGLRVVGPCLEGLAGSNPVSR